MIKDDKSLTIINFLEILKTPKLTCLIQAVILGHMYILFFLEGKTNTGSRASSQVSTAQGKPTSQSAAAQSSSSAGANQQELSSSEQLWAQRSNTLAKRQDEKDRKLNSQQQKSKQNGGGGGGRKNSRGGFSDSSQSRPPPVPAQANSVPPLNNSYQPEAGGSGYQPVAAQPRFQPAQTTAQPRFQPAQTTAPPSQPINHTLYTDDGQHVSVDINLKMINTNADPSIQQAGAMGAYSQQVPAGQNQYSYAPPPQDVPPAHAQQQPAYTVGALTQQNVTAQYGHRGVRGRVDQEHVGARSGRLPLLQRHRGRFTNAV